MRKSNCILFQPEFMLTPWSYTSLFSILVLFFISCASPRYVYQVTSQNLPTLKKKGDVQADAFFSTGGGVQEENNNFNESYSLGADVHLAYAITNHWAITSSYSHRWERLAFDGVSYANGYGVNASDTKYNRMNWEIGGGYFSTLDYGKSVVFQAFAGLGGGRYTLNEQTYLGNPNGENPDHKMNVFRFYFNPAIHFEISENFTLALAVKLTGIKYQKISTFYYPFGPALEGETLTFLEPCMDFKFRFRSVSWLAAHMQCGISEGNTHYDTRNFNFSIGLAVSTMEIRKKR